MKNLDEFDLCVITECTAMANPGRLVYSDSRGYYIDAPRLGRQIEVPRDVVDRMVKEGVGTINKYGGFLFDNRKCEEIYPQLYCMKDKPNPEHPEKKITYCEYNFIFR